MNRCIELFTIFGTLPVIVDEFQTNQTLIERHILENIGDVYNRFEVNLLNDFHYAKLLHALAVGDRKLISSFKRAQLSEKDGGSYLNDLIREDILSIEHSREIDPRLLYRQPKKELLRHRIVHKVRFNDPFVRFYFAFVSPYLHKIIKGDYETFYQNFSKRFNGFIGFGFEDLSLMYLNHTMQLIQNGSYWNKDTEVDILAISNKKEIIVGECKWTNTKINKKEIHRLQEKCALIPIVPDKMVLFAKNGFSNELQKVASEKLLLITSEDFRDLV